MWYINYLHLISSRRNPEKPLLCLCCDQGRVVAVVSVTRRVLAQQWCLDAGWPPAPAQPRICRPRSNTGELQLLWPAAAPQLPTVNTPHPNWGAAHLLNDHYFSFLVSFLAERSWRFWSPLSCGTQRFRICPKLASRMKIALILLLSMSWSEYKNIFVFANFLVESTTYCISWCVMSRAQCAAE